MYTIAYKNGFIHINMNFPKETVEVQFHDGTRKPVKSILAAKFLITKNDRF